MLPPASLILEIAPLPRCIPAAGHDALAHPIQQEYFPVMSLNQIKDAVAELPEKTRGLLAAWLLDSLPPHATEDGSGAGIEEAARRRDELDAGKVQLVSADEFRAAVKQQRASWK